MFYQIQLCILQKKNKYLSSVKETFIKALKFEKLKQPDIFRTTKEKLVLNIDNIFKKVCQDNHIPFSAFEEILKNKDNSIEILSLLNFGDNQIQYGSEDIPQTNLKKRKYRPK